MFRFLLVCAILATLLLSASPSLGAGAAGAAAPGSSAELRGGSTPNPDLARWRGRFCTTTRCTDRGSSPWAGAAGFGATTLAAGWIGRRRNAQPA